MLFHICHCNKIQNQSLDNLCFVISFLLDSIAVGRRFSLQCCCQLQLKWNCFKKFSFRKFSAFFLIWIIFPDFACHRSCFDCENDTDSYWAVEYPFYFDRNRPTLYLDLDHGFEAATRISCLGIKPSTLGVWRII